MELFCLNVLKTVAQAIDDKKGLNRVILDVQSISELTDYFVFVEGNVGIHVRAIANYIVQELKKLKVEPLYSEGVSDSQSDWVVLDYGFVVIHVFVAAVRERYRLEELWKDGFIVSTNLLAS